MKVTAEGSGNEDERMEESFKTATEAARAARDTARLETCVTLRHPFELRGNVGLTEACSIK